MRRGVGPPPARQAAGGGVAGPAGNLDPGVRLAPPPATLVADFGGPARGQAELARVGELPNWLGLAELHRSHQSSLLRKDPAHYRPIFGDDVPDDLPYVWPVSDRWTA